MKRKKWDVLKCLKKLLFHADFRNVEDKKFCHPHLFPVRAWFFPLVAQCLKNGTQDLEWPGANNTVVRTLDCMSCEIFLKTIGLHKKQAQNKMVMPCFAHTWCVRKARNAKKRGFGKTALPMTCGNRHRPGHSLSSGNAQGFLTCNGRQECARKELFFSRKGLKSASCVCRMHRIGQGCAGNWAEYPFQFPVRQTQSVRLSLHDAARNHEESFVSQDMFLAETSRKGRFRSAPGTCVRHVRNPFPRLGNCAQGERRTGARGG